MILEFLIRNYYERNGSFDGIMDTYLGEPIDKVSSENGILTDDFLCAALGYHYIVLSLYGDSCVIKPSDFARLLASFYCADDQYLKDQMRRLGVICSDKDLSSLYRVVDVESAKWFHKFSVPAVVEKQFKYQSYVDLIRRQCMTSNEVFTLSLPGKDGKFALTFSEYLRFLLMENVSVTRKRLEEVGIMPEIVQCSDVDQPIIINKKLLTPERVGAGAAAQISGRVYKSIGLVNHVKSMLGSTAIGQLPIISHVDTARYLRMLSAAKSLGFAYSELLSYFGLRVPNMLEIYASTDMIMYRMGDKTFCSYFDGNLQEPISLSEPFRAAEVEAFHRMHNVQFMLTYSENTIERASVPKYGDRYYYDLVSLLGLPESRDLFVRSDRCLKGHKGGVLDAQNVERAEAFS